MKNFKTLFNRFLKAHDLEAAEVVATVKSVTIERSEVDGRPDRKLIAQFVELEKPMILNSTNAEALERIFGSEHIEHWRGQVVLYADTAMYGGKLVPCIRIKPAAKL